jgi:hypothetical protein
VELSPSTLPTGAANASPGGTAAMRQIMPGSAETAALTAMVGNASRKRKPK